jgi:signal peptidase II
MENKENLEKARRKVYFFFLISISVFVINSLFKLAALQNKCFIFCLNAVTNAGAAFSLFENFSFIQALLIIIALAVLFLTIYFYIKHSDQSKLILWALPLIFIGTFSNLLDRIVYGYVVDYIPFFSSALFTFNIADLSNFIGVVLLIVFLLRKK